VTSRRSRSGVGLGETLEQRIVLSDVGGNLLGSALNSIGVVTGPIVVPTGSSSSGHTSPYQTLRTELASLAAKSGVTVADLTSLAADNQAIAQAGAYIDIKSLDTAVDELATAIAGGTSTSQAQTDFAAVFANTSVTQATITQAFTDLSKAITDSGVTTTDLTTVAADEAAIQKNPPLLPMAGQFPDGGPIVVGPVGPIVGPVGPIVVGLSGPSTGLLAGALSSIGVVTGPVLAPSNSTPLPQDGHSGQSSTLQVAEQALQTELASLAAKSGVTIADLTSLAADSQSIVQSGAYIDIKSLDTAVDELATAIAGGIPTSQAQTDFAAAFAKTSVTQATITQAFTDLSKAIKDSGVTTTDLTTVAADEAAVQKALPTPPTGGTSPGGGSSGGGHGAPIPGGGGSGFGVLDQALTYAGVVTGPILAPSGSTSLPWGGNSGQTSQLQTDIQALQTELASLAAKSGVTVADLTNLAADNQAIAQAGAHPDIKGLDAAVEELATAIAGGTSTSQAQTDFAAVFANTSVSQATITKAFTDVSHAIKDSGVTLSDLQTVAADEAAIQQDLANLHGGSSNSGGSGSTSGGGSTVSSSSGSGSNSSGGGTSGSSSGGSTTVTTPTSNPPLPTASSATTGDTYTSIATATTSTDAATSMSSSTATGSSSTGSETKTSTGHKVIESHKSAGHKPHASVKLHAAKTQARSSHPHG
jgi:hypothetical protein